jgi:DHA1 family inner membrane transport protein
MPLALLALAISAFAIGTTEFVPTGLLPEIAADFHVDIPAAGLLVSGYALGVFVGAPLLSAAAAPLRRKPVLLGLLGLFVIGNIGSALAPDYALMMVSRVVASLCHGAFFGVGSVVAAGLVAPQRRAAAIATMFTGITLANVRSVGAARSGWWPRSACSAPSACSRSCRTAPPTPRPTCAPSSRRSAAPRCGWRWG